jgi:hypothetical protein
VKTVPSAVIVHQQVGYDGAKKLKGQKRLVNTLGLFLAVDVVAASVSEGEGAKQFLKRVRVHQEQRFPHLMHIWVDERVC